MSPDAPKLDTGAHFEKPVTFDVFLAKLTCFTRVLADGLGWGPVGGGMGRVNPPPLVEVLNTHDKVGGFYDT